MLEKLDGNNVAILHDFDSAGVAMGKKAAAKGIVSLGVDPELLEAVGELLPTEEDKQKVSMEALEEPYDSNSSGHWKWLDANYHDYEHLDYIKDRRIEIDSISAAIGVPILWEAVLARLEKEFPNRNYARVLRPGDVFTLSGGPARLLFGYDSDVVDKLNRYMRNRTDEVAEDKKSEFTEKLEDYRGIHDVADLRLEKRREYNSACEEELVEPQAIQEACEPILELLEEEIESKTRDQQNEIDNIQEQIDSLKVLGLWNSMKCFMFWTVLTR